MRTLGALFLFFCAAGISAEVLPQFQLDACAWNATDIVVVTEGAAIDGQVEVLETWKGDLRPGDELTIPKLAEFASEESRAVSKSFSDMDGVLPARVTGARMILFLIRKGDGWAGGIKESVAWIEGHQLFAFNQQTVPGALQLLPLEPSARAVKRKVAEILAVQSRFAESGADVVRLLLRADSIYVRRLVITALGARGADGLPGLRAILRDQAFTDEHAAAIIALAKAGGTAVAPDLTEILRQQLEERNQAKINAALHALQPMRFAGSRDAVRAIWNAWPGDVQIGRACMYILAELP